MGMTSFFADLGAKLAQIQRSWGAVRPTDGAVFLRVWQDRGRNIDGTQYVELTRHERFVDDPDNFGWNERLKHVELLRQGRKCFLVMCIAKDVAQYPRVIREFDEERIFETRDPIEIDGDWFIRLGRPVSARDVMREAARLRQMETTQSNVG